MSDPRSRRDCAPDITSQLDGLRDLGGGNYSAFCPAHDDRSPSLSIKRCDDGRVLLHCFAGCNIEDVCGALGLTLSDLMPERAIDHRKGRVRSTMPAREALISLDHESLVVVLIAKDAHKQQRVDKEMLQRLEEAVARIGQIRDSVDPARHRP